MSSNNMVCIGGLAMKEKVKVFVCKNCGYEDSSFIPMNNKDKVWCPNCKLKVDKHTIEMNFEPDMTIEEFNNLLKYINENHSLRALKGKMIKYISPTIDFRTGCIGQVVLDDKIFKKVNENRHKNLYKWITEYLDS